MSTDDRLIEQMAGSIAAAIYRGAGGGYEGLQAVARAALDFTSVSCPDVDTRGQDGSAARPEPRTENKGRRPMTDLPVLPPANGPRRHPENVRTHRPDRQPLPREDRAVASLSPASLPVLPPGAVEAAAHDLASLLVNPEFGPTHFQLKMRLHEKASVAAAAFLRALAAEPEPVRQGFARFLHPEAYEALDEAYDYSPADVRRRLMVVLGGPDDNS